MRGRAGCGRASVVLIDGTGREGDGRPSPAPGRRSRGSRDGQFGARPRSGARALARASPPCGPNGWRGSPRRRRARRWQLVLVADGAHPELSRGGPASRTARAASCARRRSNREARAGLVRGARRLSTRWHFAPPPANRLFVDFRGEPFPPRSRGDFRGDARGTRRGMDGRRADAAAAAGWTRHRRCPREHCARRRRRWRRSFSRSRSRVDHAPTSRPDLTYDSRRTCYLDFDVGGRARCPTRMSRRSG